MTLPVPQDTKFRDVYEQIIPRWMHGFRLWRVGYAVALHLDILGDAAAAAIKIGWPGGYSSEADPLIGKDRRIIRGPTQPDASFEADCRSWLDIHARKGNRWLILERVLAAFATAPAWAQIIDNDGATYTLSTDGSMTYASRSWNWDNHPEYTGRFWLVVPNSIVGLVPSTVTWDELDQAAAQWDQPPRLWDFEWNVWPETLQSLVEAYRSEHAFCDCICIVDDEYNWDLAVPDGTWGNADNRSIAAYYATGTIHA